jgi:superfamily II DNA/RNA helicase
MGFVEDIEMIVACTPKTRQTLLFSATLDGQVGRMAQKITKDPQVIKVAGATARHENIEQRVHFVDDVSHKGRLLDHLLRDVTIDQAVVFTATKRDADALSERLNVAGFSTAALHGDMQQGARNRTLNAMRNRHVRVLVATDVAARGIDVPTITHVFNFDLPRSPEDYVHRIGRTGRAGRNGLAISLAHHAEFRDVKNIERYTRQDIPVEVVVGHEPRKSAMARPRKPGWKPGDGKQSYKGAGRGEARYGKPAAPKRDGYARTDARRKDSYGDSRRALGDR